MTNTNIQNIVDDFITKLTEAAKSMALKTLEDAVGPAQQRAPRSLTGTKRSPKELAHVLDRLLVYIRAKPGSRMEQISKGLNLRTVQLVLPVKKLVAAKQITTKGQKRSTQYFPSSKSARVKAKAKAKPAKAKAKTAKAKAKTAKAKKPAAKPASAKKSGGKAAKLASAPPANSKPASLASPAPDKPAPSPD